MWTLNGRPNEIHLNQIVASVEPSGPRQGGYQENTFLIKMGGPGEKYRLAIPYPWASNKKNGSLIFIETLKNNILGLNPTPINPEETQIYDSARKLKNETVDLINVQEMHQHYNYNDFGYLTFWINANQWYSVSYRHKISSESILFVPCRLPGVMNIRMLTDPSIVYNYKLWVINGKIFDLQPFVVPLGKDSFCGAEPDTYTIKPMPQGAGYEEDIKIHTTNWDSSDDEL